MKIFYYFFFILFCIGCANPQKLVDQYNYDKALKVSTKRLKKGKVKWGHLVAFEKSFRVLTMQDSAEIHAMRVAGRPELWPLIYEKAVMISERQRKVAPVLQRLDQTDYEPVVTLYPIDPLLEEATTKSALYYYAGAMEFLETARNGNRQAARKAYALLEECLSYRNSFKDAPNLQDEMYALGTTNVLIDPIISPYDPKLEFLLLDEVFGRKKYPLRYDWQVFHVDETTVDEPDLILELKFFDEYVSSEDCNVSSCTNTKTIEVGEIETQAWSDQDSAYVTVKEKVYEEVSIKITTYEQTKSASLKMSYRLFDPRTSETWEYVVFRGSKDWSNIYSTTNGDNRAAGAACNDRGGSRECFPHDHRLWIAAACDIRYPFYRQIKKRID